MPVEGVAVGDEAGAVPVLEAAPQAGREGEEEQVALEREAAEDRARGLDDLAGGLGDPGLVPVVVAREGQLERGATSLEAARPYHPQLEGGVHQRVKVPGQVGALLEGEGRGHFPGGRETLEAHGDGAIQLTLQVDEGRSGDDLGMGGVHVVGADGQVVAVDAVAYREVTR